MLLHDLLTTRSTSPVPGRPSPRCSGLTFFSVPHSGRRRRRVAYLKPRPLLARFLFPAPPPFPLELVPSLFLVVVKYLSGLPGKKMVLRGSRTPFFA